MQKALRSNQAQPAEPFGVLTAPGIAGQFPVKRPGILETGDPTAWFRETHNLARDLFISYLAGP